MPLVVGMGTLVTVLLSVVPSWIEPSLFAHPGGRDETLGFGLAFISFTLCAFLARLVVDLLLQGRVLRRHLLVVGAGQRAWDLLHMLTQGRRQPELRHRVPAPRRPGRDRCAAGG